MQEMLMQSVWTPAEVALLLDTPTVIVLRWCALELLPGARQIRGEWAIPGRSLFLFCLRRIEPHYSLKTAAALMDKPLVTLRGWVKRGLIKKVKLGPEKSSSVVISESELRRWLSL
jgi:hypothetical protein